MFQHTFSKCLANFISDINVWSNLDILEHNFDHEIENTFSSVIKALPIVPLNELELQRDVYRHLNPLPAEVTGSTAVVLFPFYHLVSSVVDAALDKAIANSSAENDSVTSIQVLGFENIIALVDKILEAESHNSSSLLIAETVQNIIASVEASNKLYEKYVKHHLCWKFGAQQLFCGVASRIEEIAPTIGICHQNIVLLHLFCRQREVDIYRMSSWDVLLDTNDNLEPPKLAGMAGIQFINSMIHKFKSSIVENPTRGNEQISLKEWSYAFSAFLLTIPSFLEQNAIAEESVICILRRLVFLNIVICVNAPIIVASKLIELVSNQSGHSMTEFYNLLDQDNDQDTGWVSDTKDKLLRTFFSKQWLASVIDINYADAQFLLDAVNLRQINREMGVAHIRNLLLHNIKSCKISYHPTKSFYQPITLLLCRKLTCQNVGEFCPETQTRRKMSHYIPEWLRGEATTTATGEDEISWFFREYEHCFESCPLADVIFDIMLCFLMDRTSDHSITSDQLLLVFQEKIGQERNICRQKHTKNARQALQLSQQDTVSFIGTGISAIETSALLLCLICKIAQELATASHAHALNGIGSDAILHILDNIMRSHRWAEFFFSILIRLRGKGHLTMLLSPSGSLGTLGWCAQWKHGVVALQANVMHELTTAQDSLQQSQRDVERFRQEYRACPHCRGAFGVDQRNCGQFICGRDAHGFNDQAAIGGQAVRATHGCGMGFSIDQALPYIQSRQYIEEDLPALQRLREILEEKENSFNEFNTSTELWWRAERFSIPYFSFEVQSQALDEAVFQKANLVDFVSQGENNPEMKLLLGVLEKLPMLEHMSYLPDMIELYVFVHKTFRHVVTRDMSMNMTIEDIMKEGLLTNRFGGIDASRIRSMWLRAAEGMNSFLNANQSMVRWNCQEIVVPFSDVTKTTLISILSEMEDPESHDYLFLVINELIQRYNNFAKSIRSFLMYDNTIELQEINPRSVVRGSKSAISVIGTVSGTEGIMHELVQAYWSNRDTSFDLESLLKAIRFDIGMISEFKQIRSPISFLREQFSFRDSTSDAFMAKDSSRTCFCSSDGLFFSRSGDLSLYEEVIDIAKEIGFDKELHRNIAHTMIIAFHSFSYSEWIDLLEGLRNLLRHLQYTQFAHGNDQLGVSISMSELELENFGFPRLDQTQSKFLKSLQKNDVMEVITVCGEQLSSEAYRYVALPSRLAEPLPTDVKDSIRNGILRCGKDAVSEVESFSKDVLEFYCDRLIVPASELTNDRLVEFLVKNNCCDNSDSIVKIMPSFVGIRNYIEVQKMLHQTKLELLSTGCNRVIGQPAESQEYLPMNNVKSSTWKWSTSRRDQEQKYQWKAFGDLWFEEALKANDIIEGSHEDAQNIIDITSLHSIDDTSDHESVNYKNTEQSQQVIDIASVPDIIGDDEEETKSITEDDNTPTDITHVGGEVTHDAV